MILDNIYKLHPLMWLLEMACMLLATFLPVEDIFYNWHAI